MITDTTPDGMFVYYPKQDNYVIKKIGKKEGIEDPSSNNSSKYKKKKKQSNNPKRIQGKGLILDLSAWLINTLYESNLSY